MSDMATLKSRIQREFGTPAVVIDLDVVENRFMCGREDDLRSHSGLQRLDPAWGKQAPAVTGLEPGKGVLRHRRRQIVPAGLREREECLRRDDADRVPSLPERPRHAMPVAEEPGQRIG